MNLQKLLERRSEILAELDDLDKRETAASNNYLEHEDYRRLSEELEKVNGQIEVAQAVENDRANRENMRQTAHAEQNSNAGLEVPRQSQNEGGDAEERGRGDESYGPFRSLGEQLRAVIAATRDNDQRSQMQLLEVRAPTGLSTVVGEDGGFLVQTDFTRDIWQRTYEIGAILSRVRRFPISSGANGTAIPRIKETSRATGSRWGGVRAYRVAEGGEVTASRPKIDKLKLELEKLAALVYLTDEVINDASMLETLVREIVPEELRFTLEDEILNGDGVAKCLGVLNAPCLVTVAKESGQTATTIVPENIVKMWARMWGRSRINGVWVHNQDIEPQIHTLVSTDSSAYGFPVYLPPNGFSQSPFSTLYGRSMIPVEYCPTLGTVGDVIFADWSQYALIEKGGIQAASSLHVRFIYDEQVLRFTWRNNGAPLWASALTPMKGSNTLSPFVALATRS